MSKLNFLELILFEDEDFYVINKPPFISSLEDRSRPDNLLSIARDFNIKASLCHRLDKDTSGCMVVAKSEEAYRHMAIQLQERQVQKKYHALTQGTLDFNDYTVDMPIGVKSGGVARIDFQNGKPAITLFNTLKSYNGYTLIECQPVSGRLHQIRLHLAYVNAPIVGDQAYGGKEFYLSGIKRKYKPAKEGEEQPLIKRFALHAASIVFEDIGGKEICIEAPYPKDFRALIRQLDRYARI